MTLREYCDVFGIAEVEDALWHAIENEHIIHAGGRQAVIDEAMEVAARDPELVEIEL